MATVNLPTKSRTFFLGPAQEYINLMSPDGTVVTFYQSYHITTDVKIAEWLASEGIEEVTGNPKHKAPELPSRIQPRGQSYASPTMITPQEVLQAAITSSAQTPQAAPSTSIPSTK